MVHQVSCVDIAERHRTGQVRIIDVRTAWEWDLAHVEGTELLDQDLLGELQALPTDTPLAFLCHHGVRSDHAARHFAGLGFSDVSNIVGGIEAWSLQVDPEVPRY